MVGIVIDKNPIVIKDLFNNNDFLNIKKLFNDVKSFSYEEGFSRWIAADSQIKELKNYAYMITPLARSLFNSKSLLPTYTLFSHYEGINSRLHKHKDDNACTYTIDMCLYQKNPWDLYVEGNPYTLSPNEALAYYGNEQEHWRQDFPDPENNNVAMIFFHFAEPDHWFFTKGQSYISVIRNQISEEEWEKNNKL
jgi:hypothetical protein